MARRYIGDAVVYLTYRDTIGQRERYIVTVVVKGGDGKRYTWRTDDLRTGVGGVSSGKGYAYPVDAPEAYDKVAQDAIAFGMHTEGEEGSQEQRELEAQGFAPYATAKVIEKGVEYASSEKEGWRFRRTRKGPIFNE